MSGLAGSLAIHTRLQLPMACAVQRAAGCSPGLTDAPVGSAALTVTLNDSQWADSSKEDAFLLT